MTQKADANRQDARREAIEKAAYTVLIRDGYKAASIFAIAKEAKASNETLYRWYGNKQGLFKALVERNAADARDLLADALSFHADPLQTLKALGPILLRVVTSEKAVALNRAAAGDVYDTQTLGAALSQGGRGAIVPLIARLLSDAHEAGALTLDDPAEAAALYIDLLVGDLQIRRAIGALEQPGEAELADRSDRALSVFLSVCGCRAS